MDNANSLAQFWDGFLTAPSARGVLMDYVGLSKVNPLLWF